MKEHISSGDKTMTRRPGKPFKVDPQRVISVLKKHKSAIILPNNKVVSKLDPVWDLISKELDNQLSARTLYSKVCTADIRKQISSDLECNELDVSADDAPRDADSSGTPENDSSIKPDEEEFEVWVDKQKFENLFVEKTYIRREAARGKQYGRNCTTLEPGRWQHFLTDAIWKTKKLKCGSNFHNSKMTLDGSNGSANGTYIFNYKITKQN